MRPFRVFVCAVVLATGSVPLRAAEPANPAEVRLKAAEELAARIDRLMETRWKAEKVDPAPPSDDAEFLRRVYLELVGRIPSVTEVRSFLKDPQPDKRRRLIRDLMASH